jgi:hypothetical protein
MTLINHAKKKSILLLKLLSILKKRSQSNLDHVRIKLLTILLSILIALFICLIH